MMDDCYLRVGDEVVIDLESNFGSSWNKIPNGTKGVVIARKFHTIYVERTGVSCYFEQPGVYQLLGAPSVKFETGEQLVVPSNILKFADPTVEETRTEEIADMRIAARTDGRNGFFKYRDILNQKVRISDLPDDKFWPGDIVYSERGKLAFQPENERYFVAEGIERYWERTPYRVRWVDPVTHKNARRGHTYAQEDELKLVSRGNIWREAHGEPLVFADIREEAAYYHATGRAEEMRNPYSESKNYAWTRSEALRAIKEGIADVMSANDGLLGSAPSISVYRLINREVGERVRQAALEGFKASLD